MRDRTARVRGHLPDEIDEPVIQKVEADAQPILYIAFSIDRHSALEITDYAERYVKDQLQTLAGVANVTMFGEREYSMRIWLDPERLAAYSLTPQDVENALSVKMSTCRRAASKASSANSPCCRRPTSRRRSNSTISSSRTQRAISFDFPMWAMLSLGPWMSAASSASTASRRLRSVW